MSYYFRFSFLSRMRFQLLSFFPTTKKKKEAFTEALPPADTNDQAAGGPHFADRAANQKGT